MGVGASFEMYKNDVNSSLGDYEVQFQSLSTVKFSDFAVVFVDKALQNYPVFTELKKNIIFVEGSEKFKDYSNTPNLISIFKSKGLSRAAKVLAVGGGSVQDAVAFACSIYKRGIAWTFVPTTLMSMADSCIGGKNSINFENTKNILGTFHPPSKVIIDAEFCDQLPKAAIISGLCEAVKICFVRNEETFQDFLDVMNSCSGTDLYTKIISLTLEAKTWFIEVDEFDVSERQLLNFGHTFAHALEVSTERAVPHGVAVGIGMLAALEWQDEQRKDSRHLKLENFITQILIESDIFRREDFTFNQIEFISALKNDKKGSSTEINFILPSHKVNGVEKFAFPIEEGTIRALEALKKILSRFNG